MRFVSHLVLFALLGGSVFALNSRREIRHAPGALVTAEPVQQSIPAKSLGSVRGYTLTAVAKYSLQARVLHTKRYWADGADLVPFDVALGWGCMSDQAVLDHLEISQGNRFFFYEWQTAPSVPIDAITCHAANNHVIAANAQVASAIRWLRAGQLVTLRGYLVNASGPNGFHWNTSLRRDDSGNGACELFYVESAQVVDGI